MSVAVSFHMSVDWRWQRVKELADAKAAPNHSRDDKWVRRAYKYQKRKKMLHVHTEARLEAAYPDIHLAFKINDNLCSHFRWIIEAAVLANVDQEELAEYIALTSEVIEAYEKLFFDVRSKLSSPGYITGSVLGQFIAAGVSGTDPDGFWKILAYHGGWEHVRGCWCAGQATPEAMTFYRTMAMQQLVLKSAASGLSVQPNSFNEVDLLRVGMERVQYEEEHGKGISSDKISVALQALVGNIEVAVQNPRAKLSAEEPRSALPSAAAIYARGDKELPEDD